MCLARASKGWYQDLEQVWTARGRQEYFASEWFEQANRRWEKMLTRIGLEQDVFWTQAQDVACIALCGSHSKAAEVGRRQRKAECCVNELQHGWVTGRLHWEKIPSGRCQ